MSSLLRDPGYAPPFIAPEPDSWESMLHQGIAAAGDDAPDFLQGVWRALEPIREKDGQFILPMGKDSGELAERKSLVKALLQVSLQSSSA